MLKAFNSLQITGLFAASPWLLGLLRVAEFSWAGVAFWIGLVVYLLFFVLMTGAVYTAIEKDL